MKKWAYITASTIAAVICLCFAISCSKHIAENVPPIKEIVYVPVNDSVAVNKVVLLNEELRRTRDSLQLLKTDTTMSAELFVAKYKLERIRYYNDIAAKGNNIKYIRGWIKRTLE